MAKDTYYFSHDYNTRNDQKIKKLISKHGLLGYGIFWAIIEDLYNNANALRTDYESIAYDLRTEESVIKSIINDFDLFVLNGDFLGSISIQNRLDERNKKSIKAKESANYRWNKIERNANALQSQYDPNAIKERKGKEIKGNERKLNESIGNEILLKKGINPSPFLNYEIDSNKITETKERKKVALKKEIELPFQTPEFKATWDLWKAYRAKAHKAKYFDDVSENKALAQIFNKSKQNEKTAIAIIRQSIDNNWKGFFELKNENNGTHGQNGFNQNGKNNNGKVSGTQNLIDGIEYYEFA